ncbi:MAG: hypothetical protein ACE5E1_07065 [Phycisphaerae bacterium]
MIFAEIGKVVGAKVAGGIITCAAVAGGIWCYFNWDRVEAFGHVVKLLLLWLAIAAALPWASYLFMRPLIHFQNNLQSARSAAAVSVGLIGAFCLLDILIALRLGDWHDAGGFTWFVAILGFAAAGAYNFVICESLARYVDA